MKAELRTITPEDAEIMLLYNNRNRSVDPRHVSRLAREITLGRWKVNGDTICMSGNLLIDGQHRLLAIIEAGIPVQTLVAEGVDKDAFDTKDTGRRRSPADTLSVRGEKNCVRLAAALAVVDRYMTSRMTSGSVRYTNSEIEVLLEKYPGVRDSIAPTHETKKLIPASMFTACHYLFSLQDPKLADYFVSTLISGSNIAEGSPLYIFRERLVNNAMSKAKLPSDYIMALAIKTWNALRTGTRIGSLRYTTDGEKTEAFPIIQ